MLSPDRDEAPGDECDTAAGDERDGASGGERDAAQGAASEPVIGAECGSATAGRGDRQSLRIVLAMIEAPVPFGGAAARWYHVLLTGLVERGHRVTAFAACSRPEEIEQARALFPAPRFDLRCHAFPRRAGLGAKLETLRRPFSYFAAPELRAGLDRELARGFDVLHLEQLWAGWVGMEHADRALLNVHYLSDLDLACAPPTSLEQRAIHALRRRGERRLLRHYPNIATLTPRLSAAVARISPAAAVHTVPMSLDLALYPWSPRPVRAGGDTRVVTLIGSFDWEPTRAAGRRLLTRLWPEIVHNVPDARLRIVGRHARRAFGAYAGNAITVDENVADITPWFTGSDVLLYASEAGSGMKVKVLEAFAHGLAVVTNRDGVEGIAARDGVQAGICEDDAGLVARTVTLLRDPERRMRQRSAARALLEGEASATASLDRLEDVYAAMLASRRRVAVGA